MSKEGSWGLPEMWEGGGALDSGEVQVWGGLSLSCRGWDSHSHGVNRAYILYVLLCDNVESDVRSG